MIERFRWDEENVEHLASHGITPHIAEDVLRGRDYVPLRNPNGAPESRMLVGTTSHGNFATIVVYPTEEPGTWRPKTGWWSTDAEKRAWFKGHRSRSG